jgi:hypothetical protein
VSPIATEPKDAPPRMLPHQVAFVERVFSPTSKHVVILRSEVGSGKTAALVGVVTRLLRERPKARILLLSVPGVQYHFVQSLRLEGVDAWRVDRFSLRELLDAAPEEFMWPQGVVAVLSVDFAKQRDVRELLTKTTWDLVVVGDAHCMTGLRGDALQAISVSAERLVLTMLPGTELPPCIEGTELEYVEWRRSQLVDWAGMPLDTLARPLLHEVGFALSPEEMRLADAAAAIQNEWLAESQVRPLSANLLRSNLLIRSLRSSPAAFDGQLGSVAEVSEAASIAEMDLDEPFDEQQSALDNAALSHVVTQMPSNVLSRSREALEAVTSDSKATAFGRLLNELRDVKAAGPARICVFTEYVATLYYLAAELESRGVAHQLLSGGMDWRERERSLDGFRGGEDVLIATRAVMSEGVSLRDVTDLVLYDIPTGNLRIQQIVGRFDRIGRRTPLTVHVLVPSNRLDPDLSESLRSLRSQLGTGTGGTSTG